MTMLAPHQILLRNLEGIISKDLPHLFMPPEEALDKLKRVTGMDFGFDVKAWTRWIGDHKDEFYEAYNAEVDS